ncbi:hypothetical protein F4778DRAFT_733773 [Xylariomycetidae sp. FL2044]|nr:hypothetical protein F4778DRAFT_733773 [Xylariomycetidae sp. FL2044]
MSSMKDATLLGALALLTTGVLATPEYLTLTGEGSTVTVLRSEEETNSTTTQPAFAASVLSEYSTITIGDSIITVPSDEATRTFTVQAAPSGHTTITIGIGGSVIVVPSGEATRTFTIHEAQVTPTVLSETYTIGDSTIVVPTDEATQTFTIEEEARVRPTFLPGTFIIGDSVITVPPSEATQGFTTLLAAPSSSQPESPDLTFILGDSTITIPQNQATQVFTTLIAAASPSSTPAPASAS